MKDGGLTSDSEAEITIGIVCSCLPALPSLFRHYVPKVTSRLRSSRAGKIRSSSTLAKKGSIFSSRGTQTGRHRHDSVDPRLLDGKYLELSERASQNGVSDTGLTTKVEGGTHIATPPHNFADMERMGGGPHRGENTILKTVCIESYPQPAPKAFRKADSVNAL